MVQDEVRNQMSQATAEVARALEVAAGWILSECGQAKENETIWERMQRQRKEKKLQKRAEKKRQKEQEAAEGDEPSHRSCSSAECRRVIGLTNGSTGTPGLKEWSEATTRPCR